MLPTLRTLKNGTFLTFVTQACVVFETALASRADPGGGAKGPWPLPKALKVPFGPPNDKFFTIIFFFLFFFQIFKIKWPKSEEKSDFGGRLGWGSDQLAPPPPNRPAGSALVGIRGILVYGALKSVCRGQRHPIIWLPCLLSGPIKCLRL